MGQLMSRKVGCCAPPNQSFNASGFNRRMADDEDSRRCAIIVMQSGGCGLAGIIM